MIISCVFDFLFRYIWVCVSTIIFFSLKSKYFLLNQIILFLKFLCLFHYFQIYNLKKTLQNCLLLYYFVLF